MPEFQAEPFAPNAPETELLCDMLSRAAERGRRQGFAKPQYRRLSAVLLAMRADCPGRHQLALQETAMALADVAEHIDLANRRATEALETATAAAFD